MARGCPSSLGFTGNEREDGIDSEISSRLFMQKGAIERRIPSAELSMDNIKRRLTTSTGRHFLIYMDGRDLEYNILSFKYSRIY